MKERRRELERKTREMRVGPRRRTNEDPPVWKFPVKYSVQWSSEDAQSEMKSSVKKQLRSEEPSGVIYRLYIHLDFNKVRPQHLDSFPADQKSLSGLSLHLIINRVTPWRRFQQLHAFTWNTEMSFNCWNWWSTEASWELKPGRSFCVDACFLITTADLQTSHVCLWRTLKKTWFKCAMNILYFIYFQSMFYVLLRKIHFSTLDVYWRMNSIKGF